MKYLKIYQKLLTAEKLVVAGVYELAGWDWGGRREVKYGSRAESGI